MTSSPDRCTAVGEAFVAALVGRSRIDCVSSLVISGRSGNPDSEAKLWCHLLISTHESVRPDRFITSCFHVSWESRPVKMMWSATLFNCYLIISASEIITLLISALLHLHCSGALCTLSRYLIICYLSVLHPLKEVQTSGHLYSIFGSPQYSCFMVCCDESRTHKTDSPFGLSADAQLHSWPTLNRCPQLHIFNLY